MAKKRKNEDLRKKEIKARKVEREDPEAEHPILAYGRSFKTSRERQLTPKSEALLNFIASRGETPAFVCVCCEGLFFAHSVSEIKPHHRNKWNENVFNYDSEWILGCSIFIKIVESFYA